MMDEVYRKIMMAAPITIQAEIGEDRQLTITLPDDMPIG